MNTTVALAPALCVCLAGAFHNKTALFKHATLAADQILELLDSS
jgi:hypothetical protein